MNSNTAFVQRINAEQKSKKILSLYQSSYCSPKTHSTWKTHRCLHG